MPLTILLDQNIPREIVRLLIEIRPSWKIYHVNDLGFMGKPDDFLYRWAQQNEAIIITYDEDFADARMYPLGQHHGIIRLRVWPTTVEQTRSALERLLNAMQDSDLKNNLIIIDNQKIRIRKPKLF
jgi:predicted nuclease of predicted toxin-antitoxin system